MFALREARKQRSITECEWPSREEAREPELRTGDVGTGKGCIYSIELQRLKMAMCASISEGLLVCDININSNSLPTLAASFMRIIIIIIIAAGCLSMGLWQNGKSHLVHHHQGSKGPRNS